MVEKNYYNHTEEVFEFNPPQIFQDVEGEVSEYFYWGMT